MNRTHYTNFLTLMLLMILPIFVAILVSGYIYKRFMEPSYRTYEWKETIGIIEEVRGGFRRSGRSSSTHRFWRPLSVRYTYSVESREHSDGFIYLFVNDIERSFLDRFFTFGEDVNFQEGEKVTVFYNPARPHMSVLKLGPAPVFFRILFWTGSILLIVEVALILGFISNLRSMKIRKELDEWDKENKGD